jgi:hypothetical protein
MLLPLGWACKASRAPARSKRSMSRCSPSPSGSSGAVTASASVMVSATVTVSASATVSATVTASATVTGSATVTASVPVPFTVTASVAGRLLSARRSAPRAVRRPATSGGRSVRVGRGHAGPAKSACPLVAGDWRCVGARAARGVVPVEVARVLMVRADVDGGVLARARVTAAEAPEKHGDAIRVDLASLVVVGRGEGAAAAVARGEQRVAEEREQDGEGRTGTQERQPVPRPARGQLGRGALCPVTVSGAATVSGAVTAEARRRARVRLESSR